MTGTDKEIDEISFHLGMINCFAEMVACGVKKMAISPPISPEYIDTIKSASDKIVEGFGINSYFESSLIITDLQSEDFTKDKYSILYFEKNDVLEEYLTLKNKKNELEKRGKYSEYERKEISRQFCRLLSYPEDKIEEKINLKKPKDPFILK